MDVYALFDNMKSEQICLEFLQPSSKGNRVEITYLSSVTDNIRESADKGIKEAYILASKVSKNIPEKISIWFRGFSQGIHGSSTDLAFAVSLIAYLIDDGVLRASNIPKIVCATGVLTNTWEIKKVSGIKSKMIAAADLCKYTSEHLVFYPEENQEEVQALLSQDEDFALMVRNYHIQLTPVKTLEDLFHVFGLSQKPKKRKLALAAWIAVGILAIAIPSCVYFAGKSDKTAVMTLVTPTAAVGNTPAPSPSDNIGNEKTGSETPVGKQTDSANSTPGTGLYTPAQQQGSTTLPVISPTTGGTGQGVTTSAPLISQRETISVMKTIPQTGQMVEGENSTRVMVIFNEPGIIEGPKFQDISASYESKILNAEINGDGQTLVMNVYTKYDKKCTVTIPEGAVQSSSGKKNSSYSFSFTMIPNKKLGFESISNGLPNGWKTYAREKDTTGFFVDSGKNVAFKGNSCAKITSLAPNDSHYDFIPVNIKPNTRYRLCGYIKTQDVVEGIGANLTILYGNDSEISEGIQGTKNWQPVTIEFDSRASTSLLIQCRLGGKSEWMGMSKGTAWFDHITLEELF